jgi:cytidylate kinase
MKIAIDGPAGSGKSTVGGALAQRLGYLFFDTGVMYRVVTLAALGQGIPLANEAAVTEIAQRIKIEVTQPTRDDGRQYTVWLDGRDVTWDIRSKHVDAGVSIPSAYAEVRREMVKQQRQIAARGDIVMVGRDIGTVVLPEADLKIYLTASAEERARRRYKELIERGVEARYADILTGIRQRDETDSSRKASPLKPATDAVILDCTDKSVDETLDAILALSPNTKKLV